MSGQESGVYQAAEDGATTEPESLELPASNGGSTPKSKSLDQALLTATTTQPEIVDQAAQSRTTTPSEIVEEAPSSGTTTESETKSKFPHRFHLKVEVSASSASRDLPQGPDYCTEWLDLSRSVIGEKDAKIYAMALQRNLLPNLKVLFLEGNAGDIGIRATLSSLRAGHVKGLEKLVLWEVSSYDKITPYEAGTDMIAAALKFGNLPNLNTMDLTGSLPKLIPARRKYKTITELLFRCSWGTGRLREGRDICMGCLIPFCTPYPERNQALECLRCLDQKLEVYSGDDGTSKIAGAFMKTPIQGLRILILQQNYIGNKGASRLAETLEHNSLPNLDELDLRHNPVGYEGAKKIVFAYLKNPLLTVRVKLDWPSFLLHEIAVAFRDSNIKLEVRLKELGICNEAIVVGEYIELVHYWSPEPEYRLHLRCQADCASYASYAREQKFQAHDVVGKWGIKVTASKPKGDASQKILQRDIQPDGSDEKDFDASAVDLKNRVIDRFYIRSSTRYFLSRAKISRNTRAVFHQPAKHPKLRRDPIDELLVLAESNPDEFYSIFGLRQVLLQIPSGKNEGLYSRVWVCKPCFDDYEKSLKVVQPITTDGELEPRPSSAAQSPKPNSEGPTRSPSPAQSPKPNSEGPTRESSPAQFPRAKSEGTPHWLHSLTSFLSQMKIFCRAASPATR